MPLSYNRWISSRITPALSRLGFTPNAATALGFLFGLLAGWAASFGTPSALLACAALLHAAFIFDNCDGELARLQGKVTRIGQWFDTVSDVTVDMALWVGLFAGCLRLGMTVSETSVALLAATLGSLANFGMTLWERSQGRSLSQHVSRTVLNTPKNFFSKMIRTVAHNGDSVMLAWLLALVGHPWPFLIAGASFINLLWLGRLGLNIRAFVPWVQSVLEPLLRTAGWFVAGAFVWMLAQDISWRELGAILGQMGPGLLFVLAIYPVGSLIHMMGFRALLAPETRKKVLPARLFMVFFLGESVNKITPFLDIGGEPIKIFLATRHKLMSFGEAAAVVYMSRILFIVTEILFILGGLVALHFLAPSGNLALLGAVAILMSGILALFLIVGSNKSLRYIASKVESLGGKAGSQDPDSAIKFYRNLWVSKKTSLLVSALWNLAGWVFFFLEVYVTLNLLGIPISVGQALIIQALLQGVTTVSFFVPANIGTQESGLVLLVSRFGIPNVYGLALSLVKRARQFLWFLLCLSFFSTRFIKRAPVAAPAPPGT